MIFETLKEFVFTLSAHLMNCTRTFIFICCCCWRCSMLKGWTFFLIIIFKRELSLSLPIEGQQFFSTCGYFCFVYDSALTMFNLHKNAQATLKVDFRDKLINRLHGNICLTAADWFKILSTRFAFLASQAIFCLVGHWWETLDLSYLSTT